MTLYDQLYALFLRRYHPAIACIMAHQYVKLGYTGLDRIGRTHRPQRWAA